MATTATSSTRAHVRTRLDPGPDRGLTLPARVAQPGGHQHNPRTNLDRSPLVPKGHQTSPVSQPTDYGRSLLHKSHALIGCRFHERGVETGS